MPSSPPIQQKGEQTAPVLTAVTHDHPDAGAHELFCNLQDLRDRIAQLTTEGFHAPSWLLQEIDSQIAQEAAQT